MRQYKLMICLILVVSALFPTAGWSGDLALEGFKAEVIRAYAHPTPERIRALLHPKSRACLQAQPGYERYLMRAETMQALPRDTQAGIESISTSAPLPYKGFTFPLRPSHLLRLEFGRQQSADGRSATTNIAEKYLVRDNARWYLILPCPTPEGLGRLREMGLLE